MYYEGTEPVISTLEVKARSQKVTNILKSHIGDVTYPRPAGVFGRTCPAGGGGADSAPCLTPERMVVERREKRQTKSLNKTNLTNTKNFTKRGQRSGQGQVKGQNYRFPHYWLPSPTGAALIGAIRPERVRRLVRRRAVLKML